MSVSKERALGRADCALAAFQLILRQRGVTGATLEGSGFWKVGQTRLVIGLRTRKRNVGLTWGVTDQQSEIRFEASLFVRGQVVTLVYYAERASEDWRMLGNAADMQRDLATLWRQYARDAQGSVRLDDTPAVNPFQVLDDMVRLYKKRS